MKDKGTDNDRHAAAVRSESPLPSQYAVPNQFRSQYRTGRTTIRLPILNYGTNKRNEVPINGSGIF